MPTQRYALEAGGPQRLEISWRGFWKDTTIQLDGNAISTIPGQKELRAGQEFVLPDKSVLRVQLVTGLTSELRILRDGKPLPNSASDPATRLKTAYGIVFFIAGLNIVLGLVSELFQVEFLQQLGIGVFSIGFGLIFLALGFAVRRQSQIALIIAIAIFALDGILGLAVSASAGGRPSTVGIIVRIFLLIPMVQGVVAIKTLKAQTS